MSDVLPGTAPLTIEGDLAELMVAGIGAWLDRELAGSVERRPRDRAPEESRGKLLEIVGAVDPREPADMRLVAPVSGNRSDPGSIGEGNGYRVYAVRWPALRGVWGEGLMLLPDGEIYADVIALPDCDHTPEMLTGLADGVAEPAQFARRLAENGCRVVVPCLVNRESTWSGHPAVRMVRQPHREFVYRAAFELGRHIIGYELQKVLAAADWLAADAHRPLGVVGYGEGGLLAFYAAAVDTRIDATAVCGYFRPRERVWEEPIYRNVWRLLAEFGDAEIAALIAPRPLVIEACAMPDVAVPVNPPDVRGGPTPGRIVIPPWSEIEAEVERARDLAPESRISLVGDGDQLPGSDAALTVFLSGLGLEEPLRAAGPPPRATGCQVDIEARWRRQFDELVGLNEYHLKEAEFRRAAYWSEADESSLDAWVESCQVYRQRLWRDVIGDVPPASLPSNPRSRLYCDTPAVTGYEVVLDIHPDIIAYGILLIPTDLQPSERRPVVVAQHGLEGRPQKVCDADPEDTAYHRFAYRLAERGFVVFAPQNPYLGFDRFRVLQRKANPLGRSLFSFITRQHERILEWLATQPFVDPDRIAFYGISYGGKTAMRVPALLERYCLSICSADFNEWIWKCASSRHRYSYLFTGEYEMSEWNLGNTFNHAEMSWLILPRPFMVERGHHDGVAPDEWVFYEYAKAYRRYSLLGIGDRCELELFNGPHTIWGEETFRFLHRHLGLPEPRAGA